MLEKAEPTMHRTLRALKSRFRLVRIVATFAVLAGIIGLLALEHVPHASVFHGLVEHLSVALIVSALVGVTLDFYFQQQFAEDAFFTIFGYHLGESVKAEIKRLFSHNIICYDSRTDVILEDVDNKFVKVCVEIENKYENRGNQDEFPAQISIDDWNIPGHPPVIKYLRVSLNGAKETQLDSKHSQRDGMVIAVKLKKPISMKPGDKLSVKISYEEFRRRNDEHSILFRYPVENPTLRAKVASNLTGIQLGRGFSHPDKDEMDEATGSIELPALLLPYQRLNIRWWELSPPAGVP